MAFNSRGARTRERILAASERLFGDSGFYGTTIRDVADAVEMPTASVLHHYPTKARLYAAVLDRVSRSLEASIIEVLDGPGSVDAKLRLLAGGFVGWCETYPSRTRLLLRELLDNQERVKSAAYLPIAPIVGRIEDFLSFAYERGQIGEGDPISAVVWLTGATAYFEAALPTLRRLERQNNAGGLRERWRKQAERSLLRILAARSE